MKPEDVLQHVGLTEAEVTLYITLLSEGESTASELARKTGTNRTFTYDRLNKMLSLGLVSHVIKDNKKYFRAADPNQFLEIIKDREVQLNQIIPKLQLLKTGKSASPTATVFSSRKGVQTALNMILKEKKDVYIHGSMFKFMEVMKEGFRIWNERRVRQKTRLFILTSESVSLEHAEIEQLPEDEKADVTTFTFGNRTIVAFWSGVPVAILIENEEIAKQNIAFFKTIWDREIRIYSGVDGVVRAFYELIENKKGYYLGVGYSAGLAKVYGTKISDRWHQQRLKNKVAMRIISYDDPGSKAYFRERSRKWPGFDAKFLDKTLCGPACATISDNLMATFIYTEGNFKVILNRNRETITAYKKYFEQLWKLAEK